MHPARHGDYGSLICLAALVPLFDVRGFSRYVARRVVERSRIHRMLGEQFGYWRIRAAGGSGVLVGSCLVLFRQRVLGGSGTVPLGWGFRWRVAPLR